MDSWSPLLTPALLLSLLGLRLLLWAYIISLPCYFSSDFDFLSQIHMTQGLDGLYHDLDGLGHDMTLFSCFDS